MKKYEKASTLLKQNRLKIQTLMYRVLKDVHPHLTEAITCTQSVLYKVFPLIFYFPLGHSLLTRCF